MNDKEYLIWLNKHDPDYIDDIRDPLRAAKGIVYATIIAAVFWGTLIVWMANHYIGGG